MIENGHYAALSCVLLLLLSVCVTVLPFFDRSFHLSVTHQMDAILSLHAHAHVHEPSGSAILYCYPYNSRNRIKVSDFLA